MLHNIAKSFMEIDMSNNNKTCHAYVSDVLADHDAVALANLLRNKQVSQSELVEAAIARAELVDPQLNAVEVECYDKAKKQAANKLSKSFFSGVPTFLKDNLDTVGLPTGHGSAAIYPRTAKKHDPYAKQYLSLGFNLLGKSTLPEFGFNATTEPAHKAATKNPWNTDYSTGASSGGSAALVAAGVVPLAHANDGGGSIRIPAACCGLVGLKPTRGRHIISEQARMLPINIVSEGVVTRSVRDTAYFHAEAERVYRNRRLPEIGQVLGPSKKRLRIGFVVDSITGYPTDAETRATLENTVSLLQQMGHEVVEMELPVPSSFIEDFSLYWGMLAYLVGKTGKLSFGMDFDIDKVDGLTKGLANMYRRQFYKTPKLLFRLKKAAVQYEETFKRFDAVLTPTLAHTTPELGHLSPNQPFEQLFDRLLRYVSFTPLANACGTPAIALPQGRTSNNLPISIQLSAKSGAERTLLELAYELEEANPWHYSFA